MNCKQIIDQFQQSTALLHKARNEIKTVNVDGKEYVVKSFKIPKFLNKIIYTFCKDSKAKKSYDNSIKISEFVPKAICYQENFKFGLLHDSYFISEKFDYDFTIREVLLDDNFLDREDIFKQFAAFTFNLHQKGILHLDYSPGNILIKKDMGNYIFKIVDINRMKFLELSLEQRLKNFNKLWAKDSDMKVIVKEYAHLSNCEEFYCIEQAILYSQKNKDKVNFKKRLKGKKVVD